MIFQFKKKSPHPSQAPRWPAGSLFALWRREPKSGGLVQDWYVQEESHESDSGRAA